MTVGRVRPAWRPYPIRSWVGHRQPKAPLAEPAYRPRHTSAPEGLYGFKRVPAGIDEKTGQPMVQMVVVESQRQAAKCWRASPGRWDDCLRKPNVVKRRRLKMEKAA